MTTQPDQPKPQAPAVVKPENLGSTQKDAQDVPKRDARSMTIEQMKALEALERKTIGGAPTRMRKQHMMDTARRMEGHHPDRKFRFGTLNNPDKMNTRIDEGYLRVSDEDAAQHGEQATFGPMVLLSAPREVVEARQKEIARITEQRRATANRELERTVEAVVKELRDKHGFKDHSVERLMVNES